MNSKEAWEWLHKLPQVWEGHGRFVPPEVGAALYGNKLVYACYMPNSRKGEAGIDFFPEHGKTDILIGLNERGEQALYDPLSILWDETAVEYPPLENEVIGYQPNPTNNSAES